MGKKTAAPCILCGKPIKSSEAHSTFRVEADIKGFQKTGDVQRAFHNECLTREEGVNEIERAQVLDYIEAAEFNRSAMQDLKGQNLERAKRVLKEMKWRAQYDK
jgi:hypothetical protein